MLEHAIWWQVYPLGAVGAAVRGEHGAPAARLRRLANWLDYVVELGCNGLLLNPIFASVSHGYDTLDHYRIDPRLGNQEDFDDLVWQARRRGLSILLDGVFNHVSSKHVWVTERPELIRFDGARPRGWEGHDDLAQLRHEHPQLAGIIADIMVHWLRRGIAGWRLDVAYDVPAWFWCEVAQRVRGEFPDAILLGEMIHGDYTQFVAESTLTTVTQYELWKALWSALKDVNAWELAHAIERHNSFSEIFTPQTFLGNHDVTRIASMVAPHQLPMTPYLLLTLPGIPSIYYGDEQGFTGVKTHQLGGDDEVRPELPEYPAELANWGEPLLRHYQAAIALRRRNPWLATARVEVVHKTNEELRYRTSSATAELVVQANLASGHLTITGDEQLQIPG